LKDAHGPLGVRGPQFENHWFRQNKLEAEANSEATNFIRNCKRKQKIPRVRKRGSKLGSMTLLEELEAEAKNILLLPHPWSK